MSLFLGLFGLLNHLIDAIEVLFFGTIASVIGVSCLPKSNPLRQILGALSCRLAATLMAGVVAVPIEPIPVIDLLYDLGMPLFLLWYWIGFIRFALRSGDASPMPPASLAAAQPVPSSPIPPSLIRPSSARDIARS